MNDLISVIIPVYNVERYLKKCVDSVLKQDYTNIEIILVDDGSTDSSGNICDEYSNKYPNKVKVIHKKNGGLSDARNYGIKKSSGKYLIFVDSDDWIEENTISYSYKEIIENNAQIAVYGISIDQEGEKPKIRVPSEKRIISSKLAIIYLNSFRGIDVSACNKMFCREIFNNIEFPVGKLCEDYYIMYKLFENAKQIILIPEVFYHYYQRPNSIVRNSSLNMDYLYAAEEEMKYLSKYHKDIEFAGITGYVFANITLYHIKYIRNMKTEKKELLKQIKKYNKSVLNNKYLPIARKIQYIIFIYFNNVYNLWLRIKFRKVRKNK